MISFQDSKLLMPATVSCICNEIKQQATRYLSWCVCEKLFESVEQNSCFQSKVLQCFLTAEPYIWYDKFPIAVLHLKKSIFKKNIVIPNPNMQTLGNWCLLWRIPDDEDDDDDDNHLAVETCRIILVK
jgi:hypothetical protein